MPSKSRQRRESKNNPRQRTVKIVEKDVGKVEKVNVDAIRASLKEAKTILAEAERELRKV